MGGTGGVARSSWADRVKPVRIRLEASSHCQLRCPSCPTTTGAIDAAIGRGFLAAADFRRLVEANPRIREIELSNYGEMFLNPELLDIIRHAHRRDVALTADNGANLNHAAPDVLEGLVRYRFRSIRCSIDGVSQQSYERYRARGRLGKVIRNIETINRHKRSLRSDFPRLTWQLVAFGHNDAEIEHARQMATRLDMDFFVKLSWDPEFSPVRRVDAVRAQSGTGAASRDEYRSLHGVDYMDGLCRQLWEAPQINWDGKVLGCCRNFWGDFGGNVFSHGLDNGINSEKMRYARAMLEGRKPPRADIPCATCDIYLSRQSGKPECDE